MSKKIVIVILILMLSISGISQIARAEDEVQKQTLPTSSSYLWVKTKEFVQLNLFTWKKSSRAKVLNGFTDQRVEEMNYAESINDQNAIDSSLNRYQWQKTKELQYAQNANDDSIMNQIKERTVEQQREMTKLQLNLDDSKDLQKQVVEVQKNVANQTKEVVRVVEGKEGVAQIDLQTKYVWIDPNADVSGNLPPLPDNAGKWEYAPGTEGRGEAGNVIDIQITVDSVNSVENGAVKVETQTDVDSSSGSNNVIDIKTESGNSSSGNGNVQVDTNQSSGNSNSNKNVTTEESN